MTKGPIKQRMLKRIRGLRAYYDRIWTAREGGTVEPISFSIRDEGRDEAPEVLRNSLIEKMKSHG